mgnify:CR=1 FL=1
MFITAHMMKTATILILTMILTSFIISPDFLAEQKKYERVKTAYKEKEKQIAETLKTNSINPDELNILIVSYKDELELDIYAKKKTDAGYKKILSYEVCARSGEPGPKRRQGDSQVPEGFYHIDRFNPTSNFYLSLGLNYPNQADKKKSTAKNLGGDIFIHGSCVTIGCMPMTDDKIKEIYLYSIQAKNNGQAKIPVYVFPFKMTDENAKKFKDRYKSNEALVKFWDNLKTGYDKFEKEKKELKVSVDANGDYLF